MFCTRRRAAAAWPCILAITAIAWGPAAEAEAVAPDAGAAPDSAGPVTTSDKLLEKAGALSKSALALYRQGDFEGALNLWVLAYAEFEDRPGFAYQRSNLNHKIVDAYVKAFETDRQIMHLMKADAILEGYLESPDAVDPEIKTAAEDKRNAVQGLLAANTEEEPEVDTTPETPEEPGPDPETETETEGPVGPAAEPVTPRILPPSRRSPVVIAGAVMTSLAAPALGLSIAGAVLGGAARGDYFAGPGRAERADAELRGARANTMAWAGGIAAGILAVNGTSLLILGLARERVAARPVARRTSVAPAIDPGSGFGGVLVKGRF